MYSSAQPVIVERHLPLMPMGLISPACCWASIDDDSNTPAVVAEDDPRVAVARAALIDMLPSELYERPHRDFTAWELEQARVAVLAMPVG